MLFPTLAFAAFFVVVLPVSWLLMPHRLAWGVFMVGASWFFYGAADWRFVPLLMASTVANHFFAWRIYRSSGQSHKTWTVMAVATNLAGLGWFKYIGFLGLSGQSILHFLGIGWRVPIPEIVLPVGISFFTFQALSYVIDTSRGKVRPVPLLDFAVYLSFFPHLIAGPIVRASEFLPQIKDRIRPRVDIGKAFWLISAGLFKKVVIASYLGTYAVDPLFGFPHQHAGPEALLGVYAYAIQIYADFSGYTDIAIGLALLLGIEFPQNFNAPYAARSLQDFWRRWHMTLSRWLRDYLYIPLGGNRRGRRRTYINVIITMLLGGLWHGAAWTFVAWGALHGIGLAIERWWGERKNPPVATAVPAGGSTPSTGMVGAGRGSAGWIPTLVRVAKRSGGWPPARETAANGGGSGSGAAQSPPPESTVVVAPGAPATDLDTSQRGESLQPDGVPPVGVQPPPLGPGARSDAGRLIEPPRSSPGGVRTASVPAAAGSPVFTAWVGSNGPVESATSSVAGSDATLVPAPAGGSTTTAGSAPAAGPGPATAAGPTPTAAAGPTPTAAEPTTAAAGPTTTAAGPTTTVAGPTTTAAGLTTTAAGSAPAGGSDAAPVPAPAGGPGTAARPGTAATPAPDVGTGAGPAMGVGPDSTAAASPSGTVPTRATRTGLSAPPADRPAPMTTPTGPPPPAARTSRDALTAIRQARRASIEARIAAPTAPTAPTAHTAPAATATATATATAKPAAARPPTKTSEKPPTAWQVWVGRLITFHFVCLAWIFFRATSFHNAVEVIGRILTLGGQHRPFNWKVAAVVAGALAIQWAPRRFGPGIQMAYSRAPLWLQGLSFALVVSVVDMLGPAGVAPFIYFRF